MVYHADSADKHAIIVALTLLRSSYAYNTPAYEAYTILIQRVKESEIVFHSYV